MLILMLNATQILTATEKIQRKNMRSNEKHVLMLFGQRSECLNLFLDLTKRLTKYLRLNLAISVHLYLFAQFHRISKNCRFYAKQKILLRNLWNGA